MKPIDREKDGEKEKGTVKENDKGGERQRTTNSLKVCACQ